MSDDLAQRDLRLARNMSLGARTLQVLRELILTGDLPAGERVNEAAIADRLGVSRGPVREAVQKLAADGLVRIESHRGAFVRAFDAGELAALYEVRIALEVAAAGLAAQRATPQEIDELSEILRTIEEIIDQQAHYPVDLDIHGKIVALAKNRELAQHLKQIHLQILLARHRSGYASERARDALAEHKDIVAAISARNRRAAEVSMRRHLEASLQSVKHVLHLTDRTENETSQGES